MRQRRPGPSVPLILGGGQSGVVAPGTPWPVLTLAMGTNAECRVHGSNRFRITMTAAHWLTTGATGLARGLNDAEDRCYWCLRGGPDWGRSRWLVRTVAVAMAIGGLLAGMRVARALGERVVHLGHLDGFQANFVTAVLVGVGANLGLPMSTTHVATGAIAGLARRDFTRLNGKTLRNVGLAWTVTPLSAGLVSAFAFRLLS